MAAKAATWLLVAAYACVVLGGAVSWSFARAGSDPPSAAFGLAVFVSGPLGILSVFCAAATHRTTVTWKALYTLAVVAFVGVYCAVFSFFVAIAGDPSLFRSVR